MNYSLMPSFEHIALVKVVAALWNGYDAKALITEFSFSLQEVDKIKEWEKIEVQIAKKVQQHSLPEEEDEWNLPRHLNEKVLGIIKPIGLEIFKWREYHCRNTYLRLNRLPDEFCWTPQGTIHWKRTVHMFVRDESLDVTMRYKLACIYFLEDDIWKLWNEIPEALKNSFFYETYSRKEEHQWKTVCMWTREMKQEWDEWTSLTFSYRFLIQSCAEEGNKAAAEYFLPKLPPGERNAPFFSIVHDREHPHVLFDLLCEMNAEQQLGVLKKYHYEVLRCFLNWPLQSFFMETANCVWELLHETEFYCLLLDIVEKINGNYKDCDYQELFGELWKKMSDAHKSDVVGRILDTIGDGQRILQWLFQIKDEEKIREVFQVATPIQKKKFMFCSNGWFVFRTLIRIGETRLFLLFLDECLSTEEELTGFIDEFKAYIKRCYPRGELFELSCLLHDLISKYNGSEYMAERCQMLREFSS